MGEYESFHFLVHKETKFAPNFVKAEEEKPPTFEELWIVTDQQKEAAAKSKTLKKEEKLFWRTRHRLEFIYEERRSAKAIVVHVREVDSNTHWRPLVVDLEILFPLIDEKRSTKPDSGINDDAKLGRVACEYLSTRLLPSKGEQPLPLWFQPGGSGVGAPPSEVAGAEGAGAEGAAGAVDAEAGDAALEGEGGVGSDESAAAAATAAAAGGAAEAQVELDRKTHDTWTAGRGLRPRVAAASS